MGNLSSLNEYSRLPLNGYGDVYIDCQFPTGQSGSYIPNVSDCLIYDKDNLNFYGNSILINTDGYVYPVNGATWVSALGCAPPEKTKTSVVYEFYGTMEDVGPTSADGIRLNFNYLDSSNYWIVLLEYFSASLKLSLVQQVGGSYTSQGATTFDSDIDFPATFRVTVVDYGDSVAVSAIVYESDDTNAIDVGALHYHVATRPLKTNRQWYLQFTNSPDDFVRLRGVRVAQQ